MDYLRRGWKPIPIPAGEKGPKIKDWQRGSVTEQQVNVLFKDGGNIGIQTGSASHNLTDIDLDHPVARSLATHFLPATDLISGRAGNPRSHHWYICEDVLPDYKKFGPYLELRTDGHQTLVYPSIHPSGDAIVWHIEEQPAALHGTVLQRAVERLGAACLLVEKWNVGRHRHSLSMALAGTLLRNGWGVDDVAAFIEAVAVQAGDEELTDRVRCAHDTLDNLNDGKKITGIPTIQRIIGRDATDCLVDWLHLAVRDEVEATPEVEEWDEDREFAVDAWDLLQEPYIPIQWLIEDLVKTPAFIGIFGSGKTYKSIHAMTMAIAMATGERMYGDLFIEQPLVVAYVNEEAPREEIKRQIAQIARGMGVDPKRLRGQLKIITNRGFAIDSPQMEARMRRLVEEEGVGCVILDPFVEIHHQDENDTGQMRAILQTLKKWRDDYQITVIMLHHNNKNPDYLNPEDSIRGSTSIWAAVDGGIFHIKMNDHKDKTGDSEIRVKTKLKFGGGIEPFILRPVFSEDSIQVERIPIGDAPVKIKTKSDLFDDLILDYLGLRAGWHKLSDIEKYLKKHHGDVVGEGSNTDNHLKKLMGQNRVFSKPGGPNGSRLWAVTGTPQRAAVFVPIEQEEKVALDAF